MTTLRVPLLLVAIVACGPPLAAADLAGMIRPQAGEAAEVRPVAIRVHWGGGAPRAWSGTITLVRDTGPSAVRSWRTLCPEPDAAAMAHDAAGAIQIHQPRAVANDGVEIVVAEWRTARIALRIAAADATQPPLALEIPVAEVLAAPVQRPLDDTGNRVTLKVAPGDALRVTAAAAAAGPFAQPVLGEVRAPGDRIFLRVEPLLPTTLQGGHAVDLRMRLRDARHGTAVAEQTTPLSAAATVGPFTEFAPVVFEVALPDAAGVYDVDLEAVERGSLRWTRLLAERKVQFAIVSAAAVPPPAAEPWKTVYELDPASPRLHERLRRLPGMPLPAVPLPSLPKPPVSLPRLPGVPLPDMSAMVPRLSGLLAHGHSTVEPHPLGPMLRLPPASDQPSWEAIVVAAAQPGMPMAVEVDYPAGQDAVLAVAVLEADASGAAVEARHAGGVVIRRGVGGGPDRLAVHRFVFWPTTRQPVIVIANPSPLTAALFGHVRVSAGPAHLPVAQDRRAAAGFAAPGGGRRTLAMLDGPRLVREFGGEGRPLAGRGRSASDWSTHLDAVRHAAEAIRSQAVGGGLVTVFAGGAAAWPSALTRDASTWDFAARVEGDQPASRDLLTALVRGFESHALGVVPAFAFDAPLVSLETMLVTPGCGPGIACVGGDGRPRLTAGGGLHYNVLDPRVQQAVVDIVVEAAGRVRGSRAVEGIAVLIAREGWLHLPGVATGLDDATFARFAASLPEPIDVQQGDDRFAARARLVEGPLRSAWLAWRCREMAGFHARIAEAVAAIDDRWRLLVVPTTLFIDEADASGRPADGEVARDVVREVGLDPGAVPRESADRVVFMSPHVSSAAGTLRDRAFCVTASRSPAVAAAAARAARRGAVILDLPLPLDLSAVVPHGPFGTATLNGPVAARPIVADDGPLAEAVAGCDAEMVIDARVIEGLAAGESRRAWESLPPATCDVVMTTASPVVIRGRRDAGVTRLVLVNPAPVPVHATLTLGSTPSAVLDAVGNASLPIDGAGTVGVPLAAHGIRTLLLDGGVAVTQARLAYSDDAVRDVTARVATLRRRRAVLETPVPLEVLDNPGFELGALDTPGRPAASIAGWEVVEPRRGGLAVVAGAGDAASPGRGLAFSSLNGLATLRSNPFPPPRTGRISVAAWLRVTGNVQPPLRIAVEGVQGDREFYRFAAVGGLAGGRPLTDAWAQYVLQVDELPASGLDSLRVRFDLLGPGRVEIDEVRVFDLAFDESQRSRIGAAVSMLEHRAESGDVGGCLAAFDGYWPSFLEMHVPDAVVEAAERRTQEASGPRQGPRTPPERQASGSLFDRMRSWWE
ncbi:MAG: hypothetical protein ACKO40_05935 [Planctomycetaceae bacterium]